LTTALYHERPIIYIDECGFNQADQRMYGYAQRGEVPICVEKNKGLNITLIAAITNSGMIACKLFKHGVKS
jgi:hypothetical protein